ncbi:MAG: DUF1501 domain-containing protein [Rubripirellula sp.]
MTHSSKHASRRSILKAAAAGCGMMTNTSLMSTLLNLQATKAVAADNGAGGYKALVCLFLFGGNDSYNMLIPRNNASNSANSKEYDDYASARGGYDDGNNNPGGLALNQNDLLAIADPTNLQNRSFGLHPGLGYSARTYDQNNNQTSDGNNGLQGGIAKLYNEGKVSFLANVGSLIEPTTRVAYDNRSNLPLGLFSHADLQRHWMTGAPHTRSQITGWGGRMADLLQSTNQNPNVSMNVSINGVNIFQTGGAVIPYIIGQGGATQVSNYNTNYTQNRIYKKTLDNLLEQTYSNLLAKSFAESHRNSIDAAIEFNSQVNNVAVNTNFDPDSLSQRFKKIAQVIGASDQLQQTRQVFFVSIGGWDNHSGLLDAQDNNLPQVSRALSSFYEALEELQCEEDVITFTASDFARTLGTNGQGSDHAWGGNQIIMGGGIEGGRVFGEFPTSLVTPTHEDYGNLNLGRGRLIPTTSVDEFAAELAMWFGVNNEADLKMVLPNIGSFYNYQGGSPPIGFTS